MKDFSLCAVPLVHVVYRKNYIFYVLMLQLCHTARKFRQTQNELRKGLVVLTAPSIVFIVYLYPAVCWKKAGCRGFV